MLGELHSTTVSEEWASGLWVGIESTYWAAKDVGVKIGEAVSFQDFKAAVTKRLL